QLCDDGFVVCASEVGAVPLAGHGRVRRGRLGPGQMLCVDPDAGGFQTDPTIKGVLARRAPYSRWAYDGLRRFPIGTPLSELAAGDVITRAQVAFGVNKEEVAMVLKPMASDAKEPTFSMGDDTPFAAVAKRPRLVHHFLKQRFAQVTNPPIDHLRERLVMSLRTCLGPRQPLLSERPAAARLLELPTFFLYPGAVHHRLIAARLRSDASVVADTGDARDVAAVACLLGYGADAICPRLALESVALLADTDQLGEANSAEAQTRLQAALEDGVLKIASKMGISTVDGYRGAQIFEALGLADEVVDTCLVGTASVIGGLGFAALAADAIARHRDAFGAGEAELDSP